MQIDAEMAYYLIHKTPLGNITLVEDKGRLTSLFFGVPFGISNSLPCTPLLLAACRQLDEYFAGNRRVFTLPLAPSGTPFQLQCWEALCRIPYGETISYAEEARMIGNPKACRAVGMANNRNQLPILIPCHRVIGKNGRLIGYGGGLHIKEFLLDHEAKWKGRTENG